MSAIYDRDGGAITMAQLDINSFYGENPSAGDVNGFNFSANTDSSSYGNPMATHAVGPDIHPYSMSLMPLIAY